MEKPTRQEVEDLIKYCSDKERCVPMPPKWVEVMRIIEYEKLEKRYQGGLKCLIWHGWSAWLMASSPCFGKFFLIFLNS